MTTPLEIPTKAATDLSDGELKFTSIFQNLSASPVGSVLSESDLLTTARSMIRRLQKSAAAFTMKIHNEAYFEAADAKGIWGDSAPGDKITIFRNGKYRVSGAGSSSRWEDKDYAALVGTTTKRTVGKKAAEEKRGEYTLHIEPSLKSRKDVPFSLRMEQPNGEQMAYPARVKGKPGPGEVETISAFLNESQMASTATPHNYFKLAGKLEAANANADDDDDDDNNEDPDFDKMLDS